MAKNLKEYRFNNPKNQKYPWDQWANGEIWEVEQFKDFDCSTGSFAQAAYQQARRLGKKVRVALKNMGEHPIAVFQFYNESEVGK